MPGPPITFGVSPPGIVSVMEVFYINGTGAGDWLGNNNKFAVSMDGVNSGGKWMYSAPIDGTMVEDKATNIIYLVENGLLKPIFDTLSHKNTSTLSGTTLDDALNELIQESDLGSNDILSVTNLGTWTTPNIADSEWVGRDGAGILQGQTMATLRKLLLTEQSGTVFPGTPTNGQRLYRTDLFEWFTYNSDVSRWVSDTNFIIYGGDSTETGGYTTAWPETSGVSIVYAAVMGWPCAWDCIPVAMGFLTQVNTTATMALMDDGVAVTGASLSLSASKIKTIVVSSPGVIVKDSVLSLKITSGFPNDHLIYAILKRLG